MTEVTRRMFLIGSGTAAAVAVTGEASAASETPGPVVGVVEDVRRDGVTVRTSRGLVDVRWSPDCDCRRDRARVPTSTYRTGDNLVFEGDWDNGVFVATIVTDLAESVVGVVEYADAHQARLSGRTVRFNEKTVFVEADGTSARPLRNGDLTIGAGVAALARKNERTGEVVAVHVTPAFWD